MEPHVHGAGQGAVLVDLGDEVGALVVRTEPEMAGQEIEISPASDDSARTHVAVLPRPVPGGPAVHAAVYPGLAAGAYRLWHPGGPHAGTVVVAGGEVTDVVWDDLSPGPM